MVQRDLRHPVLPRDTALSRAAPRPLHGGGLRGRRNILSSVAGPLERVIYRLCRIDEGEEMSWKTYSLAFLLFNGAGSSRSFSCSWSRASCP